MHVVGQLGQPTRSLQPGDYFALADTHSSSPLAYLDTRTFQQSIFAKVLQLFPTSMLAMHMVGFFLCSHFATSNPCQIIVGAFIHGIYMIGQFNSSGFVPVSRMFDGRFTTHACRSWLWPWMRVSNGSFPQVRTRLENTHPGIHIDTYITLMPRKMVVDSEDRFLQKSRRNSIVIIPCILHLL